MYNQGYLSYEQQQQHNEGVKQTLMNYHQVSDQGWERYHMQCKSEYDGSGDEGMSMDWSHLSNGLQLEDQTQDSIV